MGYKSWIYLKIYATRIFHKRCKVHIISYNLPLILLRSFKFTNFILQEESWYSFQSKREQKRVLYPLQKNVHLQGNSIFSPHHNKKLQLFKRARTNRNLNYGPSACALQCFQRNNFIWLTSHPAVISWKITFPWLLCILSMTKKPIERKVRSNTHTVKTICEMRLFRIK